MLKDMLAKMASKLGSKEGEMEDENQQSGPEPNDDADKFYKAGAIFSELKPKLQEALRSKNPEKYDMFKQKQIELIKEADKLMRTNPAEGKKKLQEAKNYAQTAEYDEYLSPDEMKKVLGKDYEPFIGSVKILMSSENDMKPNRIVGGKEKDQVETVTDINFGKRFDTMMAKTGIEETSNGKGRYAKYFRYNPQTGQAELDSERSYGL